MASATSFTQVFTSPVTLTYWDQSGNYYTKIGGKITRKVGTTSSSLTESGSETVAADTTVHSSSTKWKASIYIDEGTYVTAQYRDATEGVVGWWRGYDNGGLYLYVTTSGDSSVLSKIYFRHESNTGDIFTTYIHQNNPSQDILKERAKSCDGSGGLYLYIGSTQPLTQKIYLYLNFYTKVNGEFTKATNTNPRVSAVTFGYGSNMGSSTSQITGVVHTAEISGQVIFDFNNDANKTNTNGLYWWSTNTGQKELTVFEFTDAQKQYYEMYVHLP